MTGPRRPPGGDPFTLLGLPASAEVSDAEVRAAWRRIAAATHPDRADGGDPPRFAVASAAYTALRTGFGRAEALADLGMRGGTAAVSPPREAPLARQAATAVGTGAGAAGFGRPGPALLTRTAARVRRGRPAVLAVRLLIVAAVGAGSAVLAGASAPATAALLTGAVTWLLLTAGNDLAPPG
jgi:hypothetical protein